MKCLGICSNLFRAQEGNISKAREARNQNINCFEKTYYVLSGLLVLFGLGLVVTGSGFISHDLWSSGKFALDRVKGMAVVLIVAYCLITWVFACFGIIITSNRGCPVWCVAIYGTLMFFILSVPLLAEGSALLELERISNDELQEYCDMDHKDLDDESRIVYSFFEFAHRFDIMSE